jgi:glycosyltransferase involved in cell wall biosynthesis
MPAGDTLRVLHVSHTAQRGGAELALRRLLERDRDWSAAVCAPANGDAFETLAGQGVPIGHDLRSLPTGGTRSPGLVLSARYLLALIANARALRRSPLYREADLVHANTAAAAIIAALAGAGTRPARPLVVHLRDLVTPESLGRFGYLAFTKLALPRADGVIANSRSTLESAAARLPARAARTVIQSPIGVCARVTQPRTTPAVRRIGMLGRLQHWKGQHVFLRAFAEYLQDMPVTAVIAGAPLFGEEAYAHELRQLAARLGIAERVTFLGHVDDLPRFIDSVDVLVHASIRPEPLGQAVMQALAYAKPIVATEGGGPSEWIHNGVNGLLVPPDDPAALGAALRAITESYDLRVKLADAAANTSGIRTDQQVADAHAEFFRRVWLDRHRGGRAGA